MLAMFSGARAARWTAARMRTTPTCLLRAAAAAITIALGACGARHVYKALPPDDCLPHARTAAAAISSDRLSGLTGTFRLVLVLTSIPTDSTRLWARRSRLRLFRPDSAQGIAARQAALGHFPRTDLHLIGRNDDMRPDVPVEEAELDGDTLYLGCRDCLDASPERLMITDVGDTGFFGTWHNPQVGIGRAFDPKTMRWLPDPAGYFCAYREGASPGAM